MGKGELAPGFLRKAPEGWLPGRVFTANNTLRQGEQTRTGVYHDERVSSLSAMLDADFRVVVSGFEEHTFHDTRVVPQWLLDVGAPSGKRWYQVRLKPQTGMVTRLGFPCVVDPANPSNIWIDWDAAWEEHVVAWEQEAAIKKEVAKRRGGIDGTLDRIFSNPFTRDVTPEEAALVDQRIAEEDARTEVIRQKYIAQHEATQASATDPDELTEFRRREAEAQRIFATGREVPAKVLSNSVNGRTLAGIPLVFIRFELQEDPPRQVGLEYSFGKRGAARYKVGKVVKVKVDPENPDLVTMGE
ncbi:hypothetical protein ACE2AJ_05290 [Aquihabitans daechungensis]|uniref:hypothetical protein n=1 Tax=Aquihabitans daechungensis TaxID=1052257 RepID=UPI003BA3BF35